MAKNISENQSSPSSRFAVITESTPVFKKDNKDSQWNALTDVFGGENGLTLKLDAYGQVDELELVLEKGDVIEIVEEIRDQIFKIKIPGLGGEYYIDRRFIDEKTITTEKPPLREIKFSSKEEILEHLMSAVGIVPYIWGGTNRNGIPRLLELFPPNGEISEELKKQWILAGLDCSGLLYEVTNGFSPRNTGGLVEFGDALEIEGLPIEKIIEQLESLDIIVWKGLAGAPGHVLIVLDKDRCIESRLIMDRDAEGKIQKDQHGKIKTKPSFVRIRSSQEVLTEIMSDKGENRLPVNKITDPPKQFVIRRWYEEGKVKKG